MISLETSVVKYVQPWSSVTEACVEVYRGPWLVLTFNSSIEANPCAFGFFTGEYPCFLNQLFLRKRNRSRFDCRSRPGNWQNDAEVHRDRSLSSRRVLPASIFAKLYFVDESLMKWCRQLINRITADLCVLVETVLRSPSQLLTPTSD